MVKQPKGKTILKGKNKSKEKKKARDIIKAQEKKIRRESISKRLFSMAWEIEKIQDEDQDYLTQKQRNKLLLIREKMRELSSQLR
jgi:hypothetical protein